MNNNDDFQPTNRFRWLHRHMGELNDFHPSAIRIGESSFCQVLQQLWKSQDGSLPNEWRDVPVQTDTEEY